MATSLIRTWAAKLQSSSKAQTKSGRSSFGLDEEAAIQEIQMLYISFFDAAKAASMNARIIPHKSGHWPAPKRLPMFSSKGIIIQNMPVKKQLPGKLVP